MASFRSLIPDAFNAELGQLKLEIKDGVVQIEHLADDVRAYVEAELRKLKDLYEEVKDDVVKAVSKPTPTPTPAPDAPKE